MRYDGIYRIASCWRSKGAQGYLVCRYLFIRCDNSPAPWSSEGAGAAAGLSSDLAIDLSPVTGSSLQRR